MKRDVPSWAFHTGDAIALVGLNAVGAALTIQTHAWLGDAAGGFAIAAGVGMVVPMAVARLLAVVLGSIETMVPIMASGVATMAPVCAGVMLGVASVQSGVLLGAIVGAATFAWLRVYSRACSRQLAREVERP